MAHQQTAPPLMSYCHFYAQNHNDSTVCQRHLCGRHWYAQQAEADICGISAGLQPMEQKHALTINVLKGM